jgi:hypothetical protein
MRYGSVETRGMPTPRTHDEAVTEGAKSDDYVGPDTQHPRKASGINGSTPLAHLSLFNIIRDLCPDMMHIVVNVFKHAIPLLSGKRTPKTTLHKPTNPTTATMAEYEKEKARLHRAKKQCALFALSPADQAKVDTKMKDLSCCPKFVKSSHVPFGTKVGQKYPKAADWYAHTHTNEVYSSMLHYVSIMFACCIMLTLFRVNVMRTCLPHLLEDVGIEAKMDSLISLCASLSTLMDLTCDYVPWNTSESEANQRRVQRLQAAHVQVLHKLELEFPESEFAIYLHETIHLCETIAYWNNTRNFWCFITERFVGYCKGFVKNKRLPVANVVRSRYS